MIIRKLTEEKFNSFTRELIAKSRTEPLDLSYAVEMTVNGVEYTIKLQPERHNRIAVLQAMRILREENGPRYEQITQGTLLTAFMEILLYQGLRK